MFINETFLKMAMQTADIVSFNTENAPVLPSGLTTFFKILVNCVQQSGPFGKLILLVLLLFSVVSWAIVFDRWRYFKKINNASKQFIEEVWSKKKMSLEIAQFSMRNPSPLAQIYRVSNMELNILQMDNSPNSSIAPGTIKLSRIERSIENIITEEITKMEKNLSFLGTTASATPFIGLLGTVWGILATFYQMGVSGTANFTTIAPGLAESLIATAAGLAAAIPAVIAYNHYLQKVRNETNKMYHFSSQILNHIEQNYRVSE
jgi:biopolymer transport protein TolQ